MMIGIDVKACINPAEGRVRRTCLWCSGIVYRYRMTGPCQVVGDGGTDNSSAHHNEFMSQLALAQVCQGGLE